MIQLKMDGGLRFKTKEKGEIEMRSFTDFLKESLEYNLISSKRRVSIYVLIIITIIILLFGYKNPIYLNDGLLITDEVVNFVSNDVGIYSWYEGVILRNTPVYRYISEEPNSMLDAGEKIIFTIDNKDWCIICYGPNLMFVHSSDIGLKGIYKDLKPKTKGEILRDILFPYYL